MIRDTKLSMEHCPAVHRAVLHYTFLGSLNHRPFGSGVWHLEKKAMLQYFKDTLPGASRNSFFRRMATKWARDMEPPQQAITDQDFMALWDAMDELESFRCKLGNPKAMRWFSVNETLETQLPEFWPLKSILRYDQAGDQQPDDEPMGLIDPATAAHRNPRQELSNLRNQVGGLQLAEKLLNHWLHTYIRIYKWGAKADRALPHSNRPSFLFFWTPSGHLGYTSSPPFALLLSPPHLATHPLSHRPHPLPSHIPHSLLPSPHPPHSSSFESFASPQSRCPPCLSPELSSTSPHPSPCHPPITHRLYGMGWGVGGY